MNKCPNNVTTKPSENTANMIHMHDNIIERPTRFRAATNGSKAPWLHPLLASFICSRAGRRFMVGSWPSCRKEFATFFASLAGTCIIFTRGKW